MIEISKNNEPSELIKMRQNAANRNLSSNDAYSMLKNPLKSVVLDSLIEEQGQLCAYCMCRIPRDDVAAKITKITIEHIQPRNLQNGQDNMCGLDYNNMVAVCNGNRGPHKTRKLDDLTCDAHKGNIEFKKINPCKADSLKSIYYTIDGRIDSTDDNVKYDLITTLNLNCSRSPIVAERKAALESLMNDIDQSCLEENQIPEYCKEKLDVFLNEKGIKTPYVGILIWYLKTMLLNFCAM